MEITHFGNNRSRITVAFNPALLHIQPRIIDGTRWLLLQPDLLTELQQRLSAGHRAADLSSSTWQAIVNAPYLLDAHPITHHGPTTIYRFGHMASSVTLIRTHGQPLQLSRVGRANLITADHEAVLWLKDLIEKSPRKAQTAVHYFRENGLTLTNTLMVEQLYRKN
jgi:hypothetical protein